MATASPSALDDFLDRFTSQVATGFGLIQGDVQGVFATLVVISLGLSALLWALDDHQNVPAALIRKVLLFGFFAWLITGWRSLSLTVVNGFVALGLKAGGGGANPNFLDSPSKVVVDGLDVAFGLLLYIGTLSRQGMGTGFLVHFDTILVTGVAAIGVILAFLLLGIEIAVTIIEFHLVTLIAFVTVPFGILTQTAFLSERAIGYVISVGVKLMALALIVSIGEHIFASYTVSAEPDWNEDCGLLLSAICLVMLALKIPAVAGALISGGPQLSAGGAVSGAAGLAASVGGLALAGRMAAGAIGAGAAVRAASSLKAAAPPSSRGSGSPGSPQSAGAASAASALRRAPVASVVAQARASFRGGSPASTSQASAQAPADHQGGSAPPQDPPDPV